MFFDYHSNKISIYWKIIFWFSRITAALKHYRANQIQDEFYLSRTDVLSHDPWVRIDHWVERIVMWSAEGYRRWCWIIVVLIRLFIIKMKPLFWIEVKGNCTKLWFCFRNRSAMSSRKYLWQWIHTRMWMYVSGLLM